MRYKTSFAFTLIGQFLVSFTTVAGIWFMFTRFNEVEGFTFPDVLLCNAIVLMSFSLAECIARGFDLFPQMVRGGEFDRILLRPRGLVFQVFASKIELTRLGRAANALLIFIYAIPNCGVIWSADKIFTLGLMLLCGCLVNIALFILFASFSFYTMEGLEFMNILTDGGREFGRYPYSIYGKHILRFLTFVIPLALFQYYPLLFLLGREEGLFYRISPLLSLLFLIPVFLFWRFSLTKYQSTGS